MPVFLYRALDAQGRPVEGSLEARDERGVAERLQGMGYLPVRVGLPGETVERGISAPWGRRRVSRKDVLLFTQELATLLSAGLPLDRSLHILVDLAERRRFGEVVKGILEAVRGGSSLADALARHPRVFSPLYVNMIRAGEAGGVLEPVLVKLGEYLSETQEMREHVVSALIYPLLLTFVGGVSIVILLTFVLPRFVVIFAGFGQAIPLPAQVLLAVSGAMVRYGWILLLGIVLGAWVFRGYIRTEEGRLWWDGRKLRMAVVGEIIRKLETVRFARTLGTLIASGVPILQALNIVKDVMGNAEITRSMKRIYSGIKEGEGVALPLKRSNLFPPLAVQMITVGEETGRLDEMLLQVAEKYDRDLRTTLKRLLGLLEPVLILAMGLIVGFIVVSMLLAIFSINQMQF
ncbi:MAG: type II secretion system inner membrane protein GspF [Nitrospirae bacterium]|nr:type II secretion system inner membrane protein GspF [Nitrospirota bacterium]